MSLPKTSSNNGCLCTYNTHTFINEIFNVFFQLNTDDFARQLAEERQILETCVEDSSQHQTVAQYLQVCVLIGQTYCHNYCLILCIIRQLWTSLI